MTRHVWCDTLAKERLPMNIDELPRAEETRTKNVTAFRIGQARYFLRRSESDAGRMIFAGRYEYVDDVFGRLEATPPLTFDACAFELLSFKDRLNTREVLTLLNSPGGRAGELGTLLMVGEQIPHLQRGWSATWRSNPPHIFEEFPQNITPERDTAGYWGPKIVCLGSTLKTCVRDHSAVGALSFNDSFSKGRNLVSLARERVWDGEQYCFLRTLTV